MADEGTESSESTGGALSAWLRAEMLKLDAKDPSVNHGLSWVASRLIDPLTGKSVYADARSGRASVGRYLNEPRVEDPKPFMYRAYAHLFATPIHVLRDLVAIDLQLTDTTQRGDWPHYVHPGMRDASAKGKNHVREASEYVVEAEGLG